jgi:hypothetical protein
MLLADEARTATPAALLNSLQNWFWEIPVEFTPSSADAFRIQQIILARPDAERFQECIEECRQLLRGCPEEYR